MQELGQLDRAFWSSASSLEETQLDINEIIADRLPREILACQEYFEAYFKLRFSLYTPKEDTSAKGAQIERQ